MAEGPEEVPDLDGGDQRQPRPEPAGDRQRREELRKSRRQENGVRRRVQPGTEDAGGADPPGDGPVRHVREAAEKV